MAGALRFDDEAPKVWRHVELPLFKDDATDGAFERRVV